MFGKSSEPATRPTGGSDRHGQSVLQEGVVIRGEIETKGDLRLDGALEGKVRVAERLMIGASGKINAEVEANEVVVMGSVDGSIRARRRLELKKGARVTGDVSTPILVIEEGVFFDGTSKMGDPEKSGSSKSKSEGEILKLENKGSKAIS